MTSMAIATEENELDELAYRYGSDKTSRIKHHYTQWYYPTLLPIRERVRKVFEIGIGDEQEMGWTGVPHYVSGASLRMWRDFFPYAHVYGFDIKPIVLDEKRITTLRGDQSNRVDIEYALRVSGRDIDLFIDDGSHKAAHQVATCKQVRPLLPREALYVIEDVGHPEIQSELSEFACEEVRFRPRTNRDDRLIVVRMRG